MTCEVILVIASLSGGIRWHCLPDLDACWTRASLEMLDIDWRGHWACVEIGSLVDHTRRKEAAEQ